MSGETGLKRRNITAVTNSSNNESYLGGFGNNTTNTNANSNRDDDDFNDNDNNDSNNEEFDADSKETRLTLMEEILLLGLKDKEVSGVINSTQIYT